MNLKQEEDEECKGKKRSKECFISSSGRINTKSKEWEEMLLLEDQELNGSKH